MQEVVVWIIDVIVGVVPHVHEEFRKCIIGISRDGESNFSDARFSHRNGFVGEVAKKDAWLWEITA